MQANSLNAAAERTKQSSQALQKPILESTLNFPASISPPTCYNPANNPRAEELPNPYHILYEACPWHRRAALFDDKGRLLTLRMDDDLRRFQEGTVVLGRVRKVEKSLGGAFVDIGDQVDGFLPFQTLPPDLKKSGGLTEGMALPVRIARAGFAEKGAKLDARVSIKPPSTETPIPSILQPPPSVLTRVLHDAGATPVICHIPDGRHRDTVAKHIPETSIRQLDDGEGDWYDALDSQLDIILSSKPTFQFPSGNLIVELTSAVATMDVNLSPTHLSKAESHLAGNMMAAGEVARLCRLLDLGGSVIVDFVTPSREAHRDLITDHLTACFQTSDDKFVSVRRMSRHGLVEITRERIGASLMLVLARPFAVAGRILLTLFRTPPGRNPSVRMQTIRCHPNVATILDQRLTTEACLSHLGYPVVVKPDPLLQPHVFEIQG